MLEKSTNTLVAIDLTGFTGRFEDGACNPLTPLVDRPFVQHVIESAVQQNVKRLDVFVENDLEAIKLEFGNGERWGITIEYPAVRGSQLLDQHLPRAEMTVAGQ